jgi:hypothetical protein
VCFVFLRSVFCVYYCLWYFSSWWEHISTWNMHE